MNDATRDALAVLDAAVSEMFERVQEWPLGRPHAEWDRTHDTWGRLSRAAARVRLELERPAPARHHYLCEDCGVQFGRSVPLSPGQSALCGEHDHGLRRAG